VSFFRREYTVVVPNVADAIVVYYRTTIEYLDFWRQVDRSVGFSFFRHKSDETEAPLAHEWRFRHSRMMCEHVWSLWSPWPDVRLLVGCGGWCLLLVVVFVWG
jgi:hypothetical protein